jgi:hypothetical protein
MIGGSIYLLDGHRAVLWTFAALFLSWILVDLRKTLLERKAVVMHIHHVTDVPWYLVSSRAIWTRCGARRSLTSVSYLSNSLMSETSSKAKVFRIRTEPAMLVLAHK